MMHIKAGQTELLVGTKVRLVNIKGEDGGILNGLMGTVTHPFAFGATGKEWIGIYLDDNYGGTLYGEKCNVRITECEIVEEDEEKSNE